MAAQSELFIDEADDRVAAAAASKGRSRVGRCACLMENVPLKFAFFFYMAGEW